MPLIMPCGESACKQCVLDTLGDDYETRIQPNETFTCLICYSSHQMPSGGLTLNKTLSKLIELEAQESEKNETTIKLERRLQNLDELNANLVNSITNKSQVLHDHYENLRQEVYLITQSQINQLNKASDRLIEEINEIEMNNVNILFDNHQASKDELNSLKELKNQLDKLKEQSAQAFKLNVKLANSRIIDLLKNADQLKIKFADRLFEFKQLNGINIKLVESKEILSTRHIGVLEQDTLIPNHFAPIRSLSGHNDTVKALAILSNGMLASGSFDTTIKLWNTSTGKCLSTFQGHKSIVNALVALLDGTLASGSYDKTIKLWNISTGKCVRTFTGHTKSITSLAVLSDSKLASGSYDQTIKLWNSLTGKCIYTLFGHTKSVESLAVLSDGTSLASGSYDQTIRLWNTLTHECIRTLNGHSNSVRALKVLTNGSLASASWDGTIKFWNTLTGECLRIITEHTSHVVALTTLVNGMLASGSGDNTIKIWNTLTGQCIRTFHGHYDTIWTLAAMPDNNLVSGAGDKNILMWTL